MLIDWFTVGAQVLNFLILVWLLKRFLYHPILDAIDAREQRIAGELAAADARKAEAGEERKAFEEKNASFDKERASLLKQATEAADAERQRLLDVAREAAAALSAKRQESLQTEARELHQEISRRARAEVFAIARKTLADLAGATLEERMVAVFLERLQALGDDEKQKLASALKTAAVPIVVRSSFDLPAAQQETIKASVHALLVTDVDLVFETAPDLVSGIELTTDGQKVGWSIAEYLASLAKGVEELLQEKEKDQAQAKKPSDLNRQIGKRAYELYEQHGRKDGLAAQDWKTAENEIRKEISNPVKSEPAPEAKAEPKPDAKAEPELEKKAEPKPEPKAEPKSKPKPKPKPKPKAEPKPEAKAGTASDEPERGAKGQ
ncbi:MAG: DUF2934 domain-containing protein [Sulfuritalea sp.]|nr:DUF2934 domain-containing protein [Sulfuritalea sp.]